MVGYVVAINGKMSSANLYPSNGLFRKMWSKQLAATVTEAIGEKREAAHRSAQADAVSEFLAAAERGNKQERASAAGMRVETPRCGRRPLQRGPPGRRQVGASQLPGQVRIPRLPEAKGKAHG